MQAAINQAAERLRELQLSGETSPASESTPTRLGLQEITDPVEIRFFELQVAASQ
jgi:hypothetical protein